MLLSPSVLSLAPEYVDLALILKDQGVKQLCIVPFQRDLYKPFLLIKQAKSLKVASVNLIVGVAEYDEQPVVVHERRVHFPVALELREYGLPRPYQTLLHVIHP